MKFNLNVGNPPYNADREAGKGSTNVQWNKFAKHCMKYTYDDGHILYVHPSPWRKPDHEMWKILSKMEMTHLKMLSLKKSKDIFGAGTKVDFYCMKNSTGSNLTKVIDENDTVSHLDLKKLPFLPGANIPFILNLLTDDPSQAANILYDTTYHGVHTSETKTDTHSNIVVHTINKKGPIFRYSDRNRGHYGVKKVIVNETGRSYPLNDYEGKYAMSQETFGIVIETPEEAELVTKAIASEKFYQNITCSTKWSNFRLDYKMLKYFRKDFWKEFV